MAKNKPKPIAKLTATGAVSIRLNRNEFKALTLVLGQDRITCNFLDKIHLLLCKSLAKRMMIKVLNSNASAMTIPISLADAAAICHLGYTQNENLAGYELALINRLYLELNRFIN